jgi:cell shape-determining protein MreD
LKTLRLALSTLAATAATVIFTALRVPALSVVDWFLLAVAYQAAGGSFIASTLGGAVGGLVEDLLLHPLRGANAFAKALLGYLFTLVAVRVVFAGALVVAATLTVAAFANDAIVGALGRLLLGTPFRLAWSDAGRAVATGVTGGVLYWAWRFPWKEEWRRRQRRRLR